MSATVQLFLSTWLQPFKTEHSISEPLEGSTLKTLPEIYDRFAATYDQNRGLFDMTNVIGDFFRGLPETTGRLLDLGCGSGEPFARFFIEQGWEVTGVDFSKEMLELAARYVPSMRTLYADMRDIAFDPNHFDAVTAIYSLFHVPRDHHKALFEKIYRCLKPGGQFLFTYATRHYTGQDAFEGFKEFMGEQLFYSHKTPQELFADLNETGFTVLSDVYRNIGSEIFLWVTAAKPRI